MNKIGIIGTGAVGKVLANAFKTEGYEVMVGSRDLAKIAEWEGVEKASVADAIAFSDILILAVKGSAAILVLEGHKIEGKIVIDATNPISDEAPNNGVLKFFTSQGDSLIEKLQKKFPSTHFVKAFNSVGSHFMYKPDFGGVKPTMFICGNNAYAKDQVKLILDRFGWETEDMGGIEAGGAIENLCILWCIPGFKENRWTHAFKLLKK